MKRKEVIKEVKKIVKEELIKEASVSIQKEIQKKIIVEFGLGLKPPDIRDNKMITIYDREIETNHILAPLFNKITLKIDIGYGATKTGDQYAKIVGNYKYKHYRGSNGYDAEYVYRNNKWTRNS